MTEPDGPRRRASGVTCGDCGAQPPPDQHQPGDTTETLLTRFADAQCPRGGIGCPNTSAAVADRDEIRPRRLKQLVDAARDRLPRSRSLLLPALAANTPVELVITWPSAMPSAGYQVVIGHEFTAPALLGKIEAVIKAGTRTTEGCTLLVAATRDVAEGQAGLHVVAIP